MPQFAPLPLKTPPGQSQTRNLEPDDEMCSYKWVGIVFVQDSLLLSWKCTGLHAEHMFPGGHLKVLFVRCMHFNPGISSC